MRLLEKYDKEFLIAIGILLVCLLLLAIVIIIAIIVNNRANSMSANYLNDLKDNKTDYKVYVKVLNEYINWFEEWQDSKKHARLTVVTMPNEPPQSVDLKVTCESFDYWVEAGQEGDYYYELNFLEWKNISAQELTTKTDETGNITAEKSGGNLRTTVQEKPQEITVKPTDTIWGIARKYGKGEYNDWLALYSLAQNKEIIANNLLDLSGQTLKIPKEWQ